jgi:hypothetical protein
MELSPSILFESFHADDLCRGVLERSSSQIVEVEGGHVSVVAEASRTFVPRDVGLGRDGTRSRFTQFDQFLYRLCTGHPLSTVPPQRSRTDRRSRAEFRVHIARVALLHMSSESRLKPQSGGLMSALKFSLLGLVACSIVACASEVPQDAPPAGEPTTAAPTAADQSASAATVAELIAGFEVTPPEKREAWQESPWVKDRYLALTTPQRMEVALACKRIVDYETQIKTQTTMEMSAAAAPEPNRCHEINCGALILGDVYCVARGCSLCNRPETWYDWRCLSGL